VIATLAVENYRSLRRLVLPLGRLNVVTGANGTGKSNLYRALRLLADSSRNGAVPALAREGGLPSTLWAGPENISQAVRAGEHPVQGTRRSGPVSLRLGFAGDDFGYAVDFGLPIPPPRQLEPDSTIKQSAFTLDPEIKRECTWSGPVLRPAAMLTDRRGGVVRIRDDDGSWLTMHDMVRSYDSMLSEFADPQVAPDLLSLRERIRSWRFYDHVRTDAQAPARASQIGTRTPVLGHDGADLAAALQTIREIGDVDALDTAIDHAFPGSRVEVTSQAGRFDLLLHQHGLLRPLASSELSDGTLRYLLWTAALLTPRPPTLLVLNEPETSLHPELLAPLAELIVTASVHTQVIVVTHAGALVQALRDGAASAAREVQVIELTKEFGQTTVVGQDRFHEQPWAWPAR
jgi:predicted ATPase